MYLVVHWKKGIEFWRGSRILKCFLVLRTLLLVTFVSWCGYCSLSVFSFLCIMSFGDPIHSQQQDLPNTVCKGAFTRETHTGMSFILGWCFDFVSHLHDDWVISYLVIWRYTSWWQNTRVIQNCKHYTCATRSSLPADWFHTELCGCFKFTWYCCEISYWSEILAPVQQPGWTHTWVIRAVVTFCGSIM